MFRHIFNGFTAKDWILLSLVILTWSGNVTAVKIGTNEVSPYTLIALRGLFTALFFSPYIQKISKQDFINLSLVAFVFYFLHYIAMYAGLDRINSNSFTVLAMLAIPISILMSAIFLKEKFGLWTFIGIAISFIGLITAFGLPDVQSEPLGAFFALLMAVLWAGGVLLMKRTKNIPLLTFAFYSFALVTPFLFLTSYIIDGDNFMDFEGVNVINLWGSVAYQVIIIGLMTSVWASLIARHRAEYLTPFLMLQIPIVAILGYFLLDETINANFILSTAFIIGGVGLIHYRRINKIGS